MSIESIFESRFSCSPDIIVRSPGRINLIGEHTDYNQGFVLPAAINKEALIAMRKRSDEQISLFAADLNEAHSTTLSQLHTEPHSWPAYLLGVVQQLQQSGLPLHGFDAVLSSTIPSGAGMSSSAAIECAVIFALNNLYNLELSPIEMVKLAKKAENEFVGVQCGIMDMFVSMMGKDGHAIKLDCRNLSYEYFPIKLGEYKIVLFDTAIKHSLAAGQYNIRRAQCEEGTGVLQKKYPTITSLRDVTEELLLTELKGQVSETVFNRCRYIVSENQRVLAGCDDLVNNDLSAFGKKMFQTHDGLSKLYDVSCKELDFLVDSVRNEPAVVGARMMGGGFGGCTINIIQADAIEDLFERMRKSYREIYSLELKMYTMITQSGTSIIQKNATKPKNQYQL
ncbi:MAG TPA: galactokinase [Chryseolinea sp.]|nr:galactokinase [Chryseolinea sp.]